MTSVLVLGGVRSGKSRYAERLLANAPRARYVAPGPVPDGSDPDWTARVAEHRRRRPTGWATVETADLPGAIQAAASAGDAVLVDCLGTWLTRVVDEASGWERPDRGRRAARAHGIALIEVIVSVRGTVDVVLVSNEVGMGVVPATASGRLFRDELGRLNAAVAEACDHVALVVAGRVLDLTGAPGTRQGPTFGLGQAHPGPGGSGRPQDGPVPG